MSPPLRSWTRPVVDHADVARGPAHVEADGVRGLGGAGDEGRAGGAGRGPGEHGQRRVSGRGAEVDQAAVGLHDRRGRQAALRTALEEPPQVARQQRR